MISIYAGRLQLVASSRRARLAGLGIGSSLVAFWVGSSVEQTPVGRGCRSTARGVRRL